LQLSNIPRLEGTLPESISNLQNLTYALPRC
jgi:hypothetical protein